jgi:hypothetical protein
VRSLAARECAQRERRGRSGFVGRRLRVRASAFGIRSPEQRGRVAVRLVDAAHMIVATPRARIQNRSNSRHTSTTIANGPRRAGACDCDEAVSFPRRSARFVLEHARGTPRGAVPVQLARHWQCRSTDDGTGGAQRTPLGDIGTMDDPADHLSIADTSDGRERDHARGNAIQGDMVRPAYDRRRHRAHIEAALRQAGYHPSTDPADSSAG